MSAFIREYEVKGVVGRGGMGLVYEAQEAPPAGRIVALKTVRCDDRERHNLHERFLREAQTAANLQDESVATIYAAFEYEGYPYIAMEYLGGGSLAERVARKEGLSQAEAVWIVRRIAEALAKAHRKGIVHRDVKPSNILFDGEGNAKLVDFGIARPSDRPLTAPGCVVGSPGYMSPEQEEGARVGTPSDVYSLGLVLLEMALGTERARVLAAERPWERGKAGPTGSKDLDRLLGRMLRRNPEERCTADDVCRELTALLESPSPAIRAPERRNDGRKRKIAIVTAAFLLGSAAIAYQVFRDGKPSPHDLLSEAELTGLRSDFHDSCINAALMIVNTRVKEDPSLPAIPKAERAADQIENLLRDRFGYAEDLIFVVGKGEQDSTEQSVLAALEELKKRLKRYLRNGNNGINLFIYYCGHGEIRDGQDRAVYPVLDGFSAPRTDFDAHKPLSLSALEHECRDRLKKAYPSSPLHCLFVFDCCYSGQEAFLDYDRAAGPSYDEAPRVGRLWREKDDSAVICASTGPGLYRSDDIPIFSQFFIKALHGFCDRSCRLGGDGGGAPRAVDDPDNVLTVSEIYSYMYSFGYKQSNDAAIEANDLAQKTSDPKDPVNIPIVVLHRLKIGGGQFLFVMPDGAG